MFSELFLIIPREGAGILPYDLDVMQAVYDLVIALESILTGSDPDNFINS